MSGTADHRLIGSPLRSPWRIERSSVKTAGSIRGSVELSGSSGASGVLGGYSRSRTQRGRLTGSRGIGRDEGARGWITCDPRGTWPELVSRGTSGEAAGRLGEEKVGVTAGIVTQGDTTPQRTGTPDPCRLETESPRKANGLQRTEKCWTTPGRTNGPPKEVGPKTRAQNIPDTPPEKQPKLQAILHP